MTFHRILPTILLIICTACKTGNDASDQVIIKYNIEQGIKQKKQIYLSEIANDIGYIPLETKKECLVADIQNIEFTSARILILDDMDQIMLFDTSGKFLRRIGKKGKGPDEYLTASRVRISENKNEIYLFDGTKSRIFVFNPETGKCSRSAEIDFFPSDFEIFNDKLLAFYCSEATFPFSNKYFHIFMVNTNNLKVRDSIFKRTDLVSGAEAVESDRGFVHLYIKDDKLYCWDSNSDTTIYVNERHNIINSFIIDYNKFHRSSNITDDTQVPEGKNFYLDRVIETDNYFFLEGIYQGRYGRFILFDKNDKAANNVYFNYDFHDQGFHNDIDGGIPFWPKGKVDQNKLYDHMSPLELKRLMNHKYYENIPVKNKKQNQQLKQFLKDAEITDNPIIFILSLKS